MQIMDFENFLRSSTFVFRSGQLNRHCFKRVSYILRLLLHFELRKNKKLLLY